MNIIKQIEVMDAQKVDAFIMANGKYAEDVFDSLYFENVGWTYAIRVALLYINTTWFVLPIITKQSFLSWLKYLTVWSIILTQIAIIFSI